MEVEALTARLRKFVPSPVRGALKGVRSVARGVSRRLLPQTDCDRLAHELRDAGIRAGDTLFVHSSLSRVGNVQGGAATIIDALVSAVSERGNVVMPAYGSAEEAIAGSRCGKPVDLRTEPSQTGKITEAFRRMPGVVRSSHPFASACAIGPEAGFLTEAHESNEKICHPNSPLARLLDLYAKIVGLGVSLGPVSFYHVVEDTWDGFPFKTYAPPVEVTYLDAQGNSVTRLVAYYDRKITPRRIDSDGGIAVRHFMNEHFRRVGILHEFQFGEAASWWMAATEMYEELKRLAAAGTTIYARDETSA